MFTVVEDNPEITPEGLNIPEFKKIWDKDQSQNKDKARAYFAYIYHTSHPLSSYAELPLDQRKKEVKRDYLCPSGERPYNIPDYIDKAADKYKRLIMTPEQRSLAAAKTLCDKLSLFFETINLDERDENGKLIHTTSSIVRSLSDMDKVVSSIQSLREKVEKQKASTTRNVGGKEFNIFEQ